MDQFDFELDKNEHGEKEKTGILYIVSTPIGNDDDITLRAMKALQKCDMVICEEIKIGSRTLRKLNISKKLETLNEQNEGTRSAEFIELLKSGKKLALISDAGTPILADPGLLLVKEAIRLNIQITVVPGVSSMMTALVRSGFSTNQFLYAGFLSRKSDERLLQLRRLADESRTVILLETPYRLMPVLEAAKKTMPQRAAYLGINLTMPYETHHYGTFSELYEKFSREKFRGEFVICFEGKPYGMDKPRYKDSSYKKTGQYNKSRNFSKDRSGKFSKDQRFSDRNKRR